MRDSNFELDYLMVERAKGRVPLGGVLEMDINDHIASTTDQLNAPGSANLPGLREDLERAIGMMCYLRDTHYAQTVGEAFSCVSERRVDRAVIDLWVDEGFALILDGFSNAIAQGYPEFKTRLEEARKKFIEETFKR